MFCNREVSLGFQNKRRKGEKHHEETDSRIPIPFPHSGYWHELNQPLTTQLVSETELKATIDASLIAYPETFAITVKNPGLMAQPQWGGTSNRAHLLVNFRY